MKVKIPFYNIVNMFFVGAVFTMTLGTMLFYKLNCIDLSAPIFGLLKDWNIVVTVILLIIMFEIGFIINRASSIIVETILVKANIWPREMYDIDISQIAQNNPKFESMITELNLMRSHILIYLFFAIYAIVVSKYLYALVFLAFVVVFIFAGKKHNTDVKRSGGDRASVHTDTKQEAIDKARTISQNQDTELVIHNKDGKIANSDSHGNDPCPPKDKK